MADDKTEDTLLTENLGEDGDDKDKDLSSEAQKAKDIFSEHDNKIAEEKQALIADDKKDDKKDDKTADKADKKSEDTKSDKDKGGAPEAYTAFTMPEGIEVNEEVLAEFEPIAKELNATQEQAQKLADFGAKLVAKTLDTQSKAWADQRAKWRAAGQDDERFGKAIMMQVLLLPEKECLLLVAAN